MPGPPVEASIALSIVFVAVEILHAQQGHETVTQRYPWLGVEIGQLLFVVAVETGMVLAARATGRVRLPRPAWVARIAPYAIGGLASFWVVERLAAF